MKILTRICLLFTLYIYVYYFYIDITHPVAGLGDGWNYHIPIALSILDGSFLTVSHSTYPHWHYPGTKIALFKIPQWYYPGASEIFHSLFILLHIPTSLFNFIPTVILFLTLWKLAHTFRLHTYYSLLYAATFCTLTALVRWLNAISIDVWVAIFYSLSIILLEDPKSTWRYFAQLGLVLGMLLGSKFSTSLFIGILLIFYGKKLMQNINPLRFLLFLVPFSLFGLFWYIRNYFLKGDPFFPLGQIGYNRLSEYSVLQMSLKHPFQMINAAFGEYKLWILSIPFAAGILIYNYLLKKDNLFSNMNKVFLIGLMSFIGFLGFYSGDQPWIMVSNLRYSFPVFIMLILGVFLAASRFKREELLGYFAVANMIDLLSMTYYPKLVIFYLPIGFLLFASLDKLSTTISFSRLLKIWPQKLFVHEHQKEKSSAGFKITKRKAANIRE